MLLTEATPWLQPRCYRMATAPDHAVTLRFKAGRALDDQETRLRLFGIKLHLLAACQRELRRARGGRRESEERHGRQEPGNASAGHRGS